MGNLFEILNKLHGKKILIIGDIMLDMYIEGSVTRISPEAPIQIVDVKKEWHTAGGAGNAAHNVASLGGSAFLCGVVGNDDPGKILTGFMKDKTINTDGVFIDNRCTTVKKRVMAHNQQLLRIDYEKRDIVSSETEKNIIDYLRKKMNSIDCVLVSDYAKGCITKGIMAELIKQHRIIVVDPRPKNKEMYKGATVITPNLNEAIEMCGETDANLIVKKLSDYFGSIILLTKGEHGMTLYKDNETYNLPTVAREVYDVSGAGDTVVGMLILALAANADIKDAMKLANYAAGIVVRKVGTAVVTVQEIKEFIESEKD
jgi:D-glycero-beta-D-manno-heptose-7-phosphate kinase